MQVFSQLFKPLGLVLVSLNRFFVYVSLAVVVVVLCHVRRPVRVPAASVRHGPVGRLNDRIRRREDIGLLERILVRNKLGRGFEVTTINRSPAHDVTHEFRK